MNTNPPWAQTAAQSSALRRYVTRLAIAIFAAACAPAHADFEGKVIAIVDGDTLDVLVDNHPVRVRLANVDAPEKKQPFGTRARQALSALAFGEVAKVEEVGKDRYGRTIGNVQAKGQNVNREIVAEGFTWAYRKYLHDRSLLDVEASARQARRGLWADAEPTPPWEWLAAQRSQIE